MGTMAQSISGNLHSPKCGHPCRTEVPGAMKFPPCSQYPQKSEQVVPRHQKASKMKSKSLPEDTRIRKQLKKWNLTNTSVFSMILARPSIGSWLDFHSQITKTLTLKPILQLGGPKYEKVSKLTPK